MKAAIFCGSRGITSRDRAMSIMKSWAHGSGKRVVISGCAAGADQLFAAAARQIFEVSVLEMHADWHRHGRQAGHIRNADMLRKLISAQAAGYEISVIALVHDRSALSPGTASMVAKARAAGVPVIIEEV